jgi:hypothetical protein
MFVFHYVIWSYIFGKCYRLKKYSPSERKFLGLMAGIKERETCRNLCNKFNVVSLGG